MEGAARAAAIERDVFWRTVAANLIMFGITIIAGTATVLTLPSPDGISPAGVLGYAVLWSGIYFVVWSLAARRFSRRQLAPALAWVREGRDPSVSEALDLVRQPWTQVRISFPAWIIAAGGMFVNVNLFYPLALAVGGFVLIILTGSVASLLVVISLENGLRPVLSEALAGATLSSEKTRTLLPRLLASWGFGSAAYLAAVIIVLIAGKASGLDVSSGAAAVAAVGLLVGAMTTVRAGEGISMRVAALRAAQQRVEQGDLDVRVDVDDAGELGRLQAGFNRMVEGLRQRQLAEDLFGRHVGVDVARRALLDGAGLRGEERRVSVLFADVVGSTGLTQRLDPAKVIDLLNRFFAEVIDCAASHGGWVNKFEGDAALCIFGAPEELDDHAAGALASARELRCRLDALAVAEPALTAAIGVSTGTVVAGNVGNESRYEYTVIGDAVNEAARLTEAAKTRPGMVLASAVTIREAGVEAAEWAAIGRIRLRGRTSPTAVFALAPPTTRPRGRPTASARAEAS